VKERARKRSFCLCRLLQSSFAMRRGLSRPLEPGRLSITLPDYPEPTIFVFSVNTVSLLRTREHKLNLILSCIPVLTSREKNRAESLQAINVLDSRLKLDPRGLRKPEARIPSTVMSVRQTPSPTSFPHVFQTWKGRKGRTALQRLETSHMPKRLQLTALLA
jgi:hypothetical protein